MSKPELDDNENLIDECPNCGGSMLSVYIEKGLCSRTDSVIDARRQTAVLRAD
ncbi:hypothetical protein [Halococcus sediminicola]|uniref:hypothetical protein n=1 Tax=Halococcus sediminicola TaxID=1264579 RepID=UPI000B0BCDD9|nr:hypothetical protein [Halococcus sediminicola]